MLALLGIDSVAQYVYLAMVSEPCSDAAKPAERLDVSEDAAREVLVLLERLSLIVPGNRASGYPPVEPEVGLSAMPARQCAELALRQEEHEGCRPEAAKLPAAGGLREEDRIPGVDWISGEDPVPRRVDELAGVCEHELACLGPTEHPGGSVIGPLRSATNLDGTFHAFTSDARRFGTPVATAAKHGIRMLDALVRAAHGTTWLLKVNA